MLKGCDFPRDNMFPSGYSGICRYGAAPDATGLVMTQAHHIPDAELEREQS
jgi:hypothetical protein